MAAIDKIYGTNKEYDEFYQWIEDNFPELTQAFYPKNEDAYDKSSAYFNEVRPLTNFSEAADMWLLKNCPIKWVTEQIEEQYGLA